MPEKRVLIASIRKPGNWREVRNGAWDLARELEHLAETEHLFPVLRASDLRLIDGDKIVAAYEHLKRTHITCILVDHITDAQIKRARAAIAQGEDCRLILDQIRKEPPSESERARRATARAVLAAEKGVKPKSLERAAQRERQRQRQRPALETWGVPIEPAFRARVETAQDCLTRCIERLKDATEALGRAMATETLPEAMLGAWQDQIRAVRKGAQARLPDCLCPACKGLDGVQQRCGHCYGTGVSSRAVSSELPAPLLSSEPITVLADGRIAPASDYAELPDPDPWGLGAD